MICRIHNSGHTNQLDHGIRLVEVASVGRKWVRLRQLGAPQYTRIRLDVYQQIVTEENVGEVEA